MPLLPRRYPGLYLLLAAPVGACSQPSNFEPVGAEPMDPPAIYRVWWAEVESCAELEASFDRVDWFEAADLINTEAETTHLGAWKPPHKIYVQTDHRLSEPVVKHEIVHELLQRKGHDTPLFRDCAGH